MKDFKLGIQLYSVRDDMEKDMEGTLKALSEMGYEVVEFAGYFGKSAKEVKALLDKYNLECVSVHQNINIFDEQGQAAVDYQKEIGVKYSVIPSYPIEKLYGGDTWEETKERFTKMSNLLKNSGIELYYHNHDYEFKKVNGEFIHDHIFSELGLDIIKPQIDTCWVHYAGYNPVDSINKYAGKVNILHLKDFICKNLAGGAVYDLIDNEGKVQERDKNTREEHGFEFKPVGYGIQKFPEIIEAAKNAGIKYLIVEQDKHTENTAMEDAKLSIDYLKSIGL